MNAPAKRDNKEGLASRQVFFMLFKKIKEKAYRNCYDMHVSLPAVQGFEPRHTESESAVLPLHNTAICRFLEVFVACPADVVYYNSSAPICQYLFSNFFNFFEKFFFEKFFLKNSFSPDP